jgi:CRISPR-associated protein Cmr2
MSHLLAIAVGPVQEFIAAARRTRDLWFGSYLLSEISKAVAKSVQDQGGKLIFPHPDMDLTSGDDKVNVANVILADLPSGEPRDVATKARQAAQKRWLEFANEAHREASGVIRQDIWGEQIEDVIEFYAAWIVSSADYRADRGTLMRLLAGRKNCRDFRPAKGRAGVPKSSLDGQREAVLKDPARERWPERFRARLRIREGEQLDVVGVVKRVAGGTQPYPSVARIAADPWVRGNQHRLGAVAAACGSLAEIIRPLNTPAHPHFEAFPYEGTAVYIARHHELIEETGATPEDLRPLREALARLPHPEPYLAVLVADGDKMGAAIARLGSADDHRAFSSTLAGFSTEAKAIVEKHNGVLVYAGGDDVLAFLPVDKCLRCARKLHDDFGDRLQHYKTENGKSPTLSVGIAIGHFMENLEDLLDYGRAAEKAAKKIEGKDALAVHLHKRGGSPIKIASRWETKPEERLQKFADLMSNGLIPTKLPYELRAMANLYTGWPEATAKEVIKADLARLIAKKASKGVDSVREKLGTAIDNHTAKTLLAFAEELLVARLIASVQKQLEGNS